MSLRSRSSLSLLTLALSLGACGGDTGPTPLPQRTVVLQGAFSSVPSSAGGSTGTVAATRTFAFTVAEAGTIDAMADWSSSSNQMALALYPAGCVAGNLNFGDCIPLARSNSSDKPGRVNLPKARAGTYTLGVMNLGPGVESGTCEIGLTR